MRCWGTKHSIPGHFIAKNSEKKLFILSIRGSMNLADFLTDLCAHEVSFLARQCHIFLHVIQFRMTNTVPTKAFFMLPEGYITKSKKIFCSSFRCCFSSLVCVCVCVCVWVWRRIEETVDGELLLSSITTYTHPHAYKHTHTKREHVWVPVCLSTFAFRQYSILLTETCGNLC